MRFPWTTTTERPGTLYAACISRTSLSISVSSDWAKIGVMKSRAATTSNIDFIFIFKFGVFGGSDFYTLDQRFGYKPRENKKVEPVFPQGPVPLVNLKRLYYVCAAGKEKRKLLHSGVATRGSLRSTEPYIFNVKALSWTNKSDDSSSGNSTTLPHFC